jgi:hypothetical protein
MEWPDPKSPDALSIAQFGSPPGTLKVNVQIGLAGGPWEARITLASSGGSTENVEADGTSWRAMVQTNGSGSGDVALASHYSVNKDWETRLVGVETNGGVIPLQGSIAHGIGPDLMSTLITLSREKYDQIKGFELQRRKRQWVEFRNVSLEPGYHTKVEILDASPPKP